MNNFFSNNIGWKTASIISALLLWVFVINTQNPMQPYDMRNRTMSIKGTSLLEDKGYVIKNEKELLDQKIRVVVKGPRLQIEKIKSNPELIDIRMDITRYVNNISANMDMAAQVIPIDISVPPGLTVVEQSPQNAEVIFEREKTVTKKIEYTITGGSNKDYQTLTPKIVPEQIEIWGAESYMSEIDTVRVDINVENFSEDILTYQIPIKIYNKEGEEITQLKQSHKSAEITLPIGKKKTVPLEMQFVGELPDGLVQTGISVYPNEITIIGKSALIDSINSIKLDKISLENIIQTSKINTKFILPPGVSYLDQIENNVVVTIQIKEQSLYDYNIDISKIDLDIKNTRENIDYEILNKDVKIQVKSIAEELLSIVQEDIKAYIDIDSYEEGEHEIPIKLQFPPNMEIIGEPKLRIKIIDTTQEEDNEQTNAESVEVTE